MKSPMRLNPILFLVAIIVLAVIVPFAWKAWFPKTPQKELVAYVDRGIDPADMHIFTDRIAELEQQIAEKDERDIGLILILGNVYYAVGDLAKAEELYLDILSTNPNDAAALENLATTRRDMGDVESAESLYRQAFAVEPNENNTIRLTELINDEFPERSDEILPILETAVNRIGQTPALMVMIAEWYRDRDQYEEALSHYRIAIQLAPDDPSLVTELENVKKDQQAYLEREARKQRN